MTLQDPRTGRYPGGKAGAGVYQTLIRSFPRHSLYVEPFLGGGGVLRRKRPAPAGSVGIDADAGVIDSWRSINWPGLTLLEGDGSAWLRETGPTLPADALVYADPPYLPELRAKPRIYRHELTREQHAELLLALVDLPCFAAISGYPSKLYDDTLDGWHWLEYRVMTRGGLREERLWTNYDVGAHAAHDPAYAGRDYRECLRIKRKARRWAAKFAGLRREERQAVLAELAAVELASSATPGVNAGLDAERSPEPRPDASGRTPASASIPTLRTSAPDPTLAAVPAPARAALQGTLFA